jgi:DNA polymerase IV
MMDESQTVSGESQSTLASFASPDLSSLPPLLILPTHFKGEEAKKLEERLRRHGAPLVGDVSKVRVFIGKVGTKRRAEFELRRYKLKTEELVVEKRPASPMESDEPRSKKQKAGGSLASPILIADEISVIEKHYLDDSETETEDEFPEPKQDTLVSSTSKSHQDKVNVVIQ